MILNKKGFTLVEVLVALSVLTIISAMVMGTVLAVNSLTLKNNDKLLLGYAVENISEAFYNTEAEADFVEDMEFCFGDDCLTLSDGVYSMYYANGGVADSSNYRFTINFTYTANKLTISAKDRKNAAVLAEREFDK